MTRFLAWAAPIMALMLMISPALAMPGMGGGGMMLPGGQDYSFILQGDAFSQSGLWQDVDFQSPDGNSGEFGGGWQGMDQTMYEYFGGSMMMTTPDGEHPFFGTGPMSYWQEHGFDLPSEGGWAEVHGYTVDYHGNQVNVVMEIVDHDGEHLQLRDPNDGTPLW